MTSPQTDAPASIAYAPASAWMRGLAFLVDVGVPGALTGIVVFLSLSAGFDLDSGGEGGNGLLLLGLAALILIPVAAFALNLHLARTRRASMGKLLLRLRLVDARTNGAITTGAFFARSLVLAVPVLIAAVPGRIIVDNLLVALFVSGGSITALTLSAVAAVPLVLLAVCALFALPMFRGDHRGWQDKAGKSRVVTASSVAGLPG